MHIRSLDTLDEVRGLTGLLDEYIRFVCSDLETICGVSFDADVLLRNTLSGLHKVIPPDGRTFVAVGDQGDLLGMVFLRPSGADAMEIKRLYVLPKARGTGAGRALVKTAIDETRASGRTVLRLDTTRNLEAAISLYRALGFIDCAPYPESDHFDDHVLAPAMVFMEKRLAD